MHWLTQPITDLGKQFDQLFYAILIITGVVFILVEGLLVLYLIKYRRQHAAQQGLDYHGNTKLEIIWTLVPALILTILGIVSVPLVKAAQTPPADAYEIQVVAHKWWWEFKYPNGVDTKAKEPLRIPAGKNVLFKITSADVIHDFWVPQFRVKQDALPGRETRVWVNTNDIGTFPLRCAEYCGTLHSEMVADVNVMSDADFNTWLNQAAEQAQKAKDDASKSKDKAASGSSSTTTAAAAAGDATAGKELATKYGCLSCHAIDDSKKVGPSWKGLYGSTVSFADGKTATADDAYLKDFISNPTSKGDIKGFKNIMPQTSMSDTDVANLVAYIKSLK